MFANIPEVKLGIIAVSRGCFPMALSERRRAAIKAAYGEGLYECPVTVENELDARRAVEDVQAAGVNALVVSLGNFGPETPEKRWIAGMAERAYYVCAHKPKAHWGSLHDGRGDAYCRYAQLLLQSGPAGKGEVLYTPEYPVGTAPELAEKVAEFVPIARAILGLRGLKLITFAGPRPDDFLAWNGPIKALYDLGVAVEENSELDLLVAYDEHADDPRIPAKMAEMQAELGGSNKYAGVLPRLGPQYELTLLDWAEAHEGARRCRGVCQQVLAQRFQTEFKFVPCYVNSRLAAVGIAGFLRGGYLRRAVQGADRRVRFRRARQRCWTSTTPCPHPFTTKPSGADTMCACPRPSWASIAATPAVRCWRPAHGLSG